MTAFNYNTKTLSQALNGYAWILRPFYNSFGGLSLALLFISLTALWMMSLLSYQFKQHHFKELRGIYPPIYAPKTLDINREDIAKKSQVKAIRSEHFSHLVDVCINDELSTVNIPITELRTTAPKKVGFRPVRTSVRSLTPQSIKEQFSDNDNNINGVWLSSALYEVIYGKPFIQTTQGNSKATASIKVLPKLNRSQRKAFNPKTCQTDHRGVNLPIIKVLPLASNERWLIINTQVLKELNLYNKVKSIHAIYPKHQGQHEKQLFDRISHTVKANANKSGYIQHQLKYWVNQLPTDLQVQLEKLQFRFFNLALISLLMVLAYTSTLSLISQKILAESLYLLRFYGVNRSWFFTSSTVTVLIFFVSLYSTSFMAANGLLSAFYPQMFANFVATSYLGATFNGAKALLLLTPILLVLCYLAFHFASDNYNHSWERTQ